MCYTVDPSLKHKSSAVTHVNKNSLLIILIYVNRSIFIYFFYQYHLYILVSTIQNLLTNFIQIKTKPGILSLMLL